MSSVLLDTNLILLLIVGLFDQNLIENHKRTNIFTKNDFELLVKCIAQYQVIWVTAHCLAEVSNLLKQTSSNKHKLLLEHFSKVVSEFKESHINKGIIFEKEVFCRLGVADTGITVKAKRVSCVYTVDFDLFNEISRSGNKVINFNHIRFEKLIS